MKTCTDGSNLRYGTILKCETIKLAALMSDFEPPYQCQGDSHSYGN